MRSLRHIALLTWMLWLMTVNTGWISAPSCGAMTEPACACCEQPTPIRQEMTCLASAGQSPLLSTSIQLTAPQGQWESPVPPAFYRAFWQLLLRAQAEEATRRILRYAPPAFVRDITLLVEVFRL
ncbi:hypothetical protein ACFQ4C_06945 [Larkinella insperata]|uniref:Uncharacterized protein n=1 Tax=Larkinella insperata TaxID=332158 RepID=A0ABW3Q1U4_9BACT